MRRSCLFEKFLVVGVRTYEERKSLSLLLDSSRRVGHLKPAA
jgi:hypothetical protein